MVFVNTFSGNFLIFPLFSCLLRKENKGLRIFGRADVPSHKLKEPTMEITFSMQLHDDMEKGSSIWDKHHCQRAVSL